MQQKNQTSNSTETVNPEVIVALQRFDRNKPIIPRTGSFKNRLIQFIENLCEYFITVVTKSEFIHAAVLVNGVWISAHQFNGFILRRESRVFSDFVYKKVPNITISKKEYDTTMSWVKTQIGSKYDWKGIFLTQLFPLDKENKSKWFCSEIVTKVLQLLNVQEVQGVKPSEVSPATLSELLDIKITN